jgi:hypothetical protein
MTPCKSQLLFLTEEIYWMVLLWKKLDLYIKGLVREILTPALSEGEGDEVVKRVVWI